MKRVIAGLVGFNFHRMVLNPTLSCLCRRYCFRGRTIMRAFGVLSGLLAAGMLSVAHGQTFAVLHTFTGSDGRFPQGNLMLSGSTLFGVVGETGSSSTGNVFAVNTDGSNFHVLHSFTSSDVDPGIGLTINGSTLYGATYNSVFKINTDGGGYSVLHSLSGATEGADCGSIPTIIGSTLYGSAMTWGVNDCGSIFSVDADGSGFKLLHTFDGSDGNNPFGALTLVGSTLYGTCDNGGSSNDGTIFAINTDGSGFRDVHTFSGPDGIMPTEGLALSGSTFYGKTVQGGSYGYANNGNGYGTIFKVNTDGSDFTVLHAFTGGRDGEGWIGNLVLSGSTLYGVAAGGVGGSVFEMGTDGSNFEVLHSFSGTDGLWPTGNLLLDDSTLYGTTEGNGTTDFGSVFSITVAEPSTPPLFGVGVFSLLGYVVWRGWTNRLKCHLQQGKSVQDRFGGPG